MNASQNSVAVFHDLAVVRSEVGLALGRVDDQRVDHREVFELELHRRGEACAPKAHKAAGTHCRNKRIVIVHLWRCD
ncbi:hypothetical protein SDC9_197872 [bioreactor metagenome]|uniref:Uncharacterized protein n=1 Tax=bioreactor metagenome TaxID=1076179 RepID=A0A645IGY3_9ZZZZ